MLKVGERLFVNAAQIVTAEWLGDLHLRIVTPSGYSHELYGDHATAVWDALELLASDPAGETGYRTARGE